MSYGVCGECGVSPFWSPAHKMTCSRCKPADRKAYRALKRKKKQEKARRAYEKWAKSYYKPHGVPGKHRRLGEWICTACGAKGDYGGRMLLDSHRKRCRGKKARRKSKRQIRSRRKTYKKRKSPKRKKTTRRRRY